MPNKNRAAGDYFERRTRDALEADGWLVVRSAGSLGIADLVALKANRQPRLVSCKLGARLGRAEATDLIAAALKAGAVPVLASREKPGWVHLELLSHRFGTQVIDRLALPSLHMPARPRHVAITDGLMPAGEQMELPLVVEE